MIFYVVSTVIFPVRLKTHRLNKFFTLQQKFRSDVIEKTSKLFQKFNQSFIEKDFTQVTIE